MKIAKITGCAATDVTNSATHGAIRLEEVFVEAIKDDFEVEGMEVEEEDVGEAEADEVQELTAEPSQVTDEVKDLSLEAIIIEKEKEAGRKLNVKEQKYLSLQLEHQRILQISASQRGYEDKKRNETIRKQLKRMKPFEEFLKLSSKASKSSAERKQISRENMSAEKREDEREKNRKRLRNKKAIEDVIINFLQ